jgi:hypothetical protein
MKEKDDINDNNLETQPLINNVQSTNKSERKYVRTNYSNSFFPGAFPPIFVFSCLLFYLIMFVFVFFIPKFYSAFLVSNLFDIYNSPLNYETISPLVLILYQIVFPLILLIVFILTFWSMFKTIFTKGLEIPNDSVWSYNEGNFQINPQEHLEFKALKMIHLEDELNKNKNKILLNTQTSSSISYNDNNYIIINERENDGLLRYCKTCHKFKPDRSHHCKYCDKCYLKLDHHCFWLNNCISFTNYKFFLCFLLYSWIINLVYVIIFYYSIKQIMVLKHINIFTVILSLTYIIAIAGFVFAFLLWLYNIMLVLNNYTSFEYNDVQKKINKENENFVVYSSFDRFVNVNKYRKIVSKYDVGKWNNWVQVYGNNPFLWFIPVNNIDNKYHNGMNFVLNEDEQLEIIKSI